MKQFGLMAASLAMLLSRRCRAALFGAFWIAGSSGVAMAQSPTASPPPVVPFSTFMAGLHSTSAPKMMAQPFAAVKTPAAAQEMLQHLLSLYEGVSVKHSYALGGRTYDCVPIQQQASVRRLAGKTIASPPPVAPNLLTAPTSKDHPTVAGSQRSQTGADPFGNAQRCVDGSIPMPRVTPEEMSRFETLQKFFEKGPNGVGKAHQKHGGTPPPSQNGHSYAYEYQNVNNYGGVAAIALYSPYVNTGLSEVFSLAQHWYTGGSGDSLQTAEIGIQNYPQKYGTEYSVLFIYWTANNYKGTGCYNLDCAAFVQINSNWHLGGGFSQYSTVGGAQYDVALGFYLYQGNWWVAAGNDWVGYYPGSIYSGGQLSQHAQKIDFGGETVGSTMWPPMGSGKYASAGWTQAAYIRRLLYRDANNNGYDPSLTVVQDWPSCQTASSPIWGGSTWRYYFFFGGPGGTNC